MTDPVNMPREADGKIATELDPPHHAPSTDEMLEAHYEALVQADLKIRSLPNADQSDVEFIRVALAKHNGAQS